MVSHDLSDYYVILCLTRWHSLPSPKELAVMSLSSSACDWLMFLKDRLKILEQRLARGLFSTLWQSVAEALNNVIYHKVV